jgi:hypothetical protein
MGWPLTFYTNFGVPRGSAGCARGPVVFIRPEYRDDRGLYEHELTHVKQWFRTLGLHSFLYLLSDRYKLACEVEAYREQDKHYAEDRRALFAKFIAQDYDLDITQDEALALLQ